MSFTSFLLQYKWVILFYGALILLIYLNRKRFEIQGKIVALYKTKIGLGWIEKFVRKKAELIKILGLCGIGIGYIGMLVVFYALLKLLWDSFKAPTQFTVAPVLPGVPIAGMGITFPLIIGWICILIIIVIHEFSHGVMARAHGQKIKSTGLAFFGPVPGAFVEIDEKQLQKAPDHVQYSVFAAGPNANIVTSIIFFLLMTFVLAPITVSMIEPAGVRLGVTDGLPAAMSGLQTGDIIVRIDGYAVKEVADFKKLGIILPNEAHTFYTKDGRTVEVISRENPDNQSIGQFGINLYQETRLKSPGWIQQAVYQILLWLGELLFWLFFISINLGLINFLPIFITDGARMLQISINRLVKDPTQAKRLWMSINRLSLLIIILLILIPVIMNALKLIGSLF